MMERNWKHILVVGLGKSGQSAALVLLDRGFQVVCFDNATDQKLLKVKNELEGRGAKVFLGEENFPELSTFDLIVLSPGIPKKSEVFEKISQSGVPYFSEIELAYRLGLKEGIIVGVTGTNGKTTVTTLIGQVLKAGGKKVVVGGNIGNPLTGLIDQVQKGTILVCELSSFQLENSVSFRSQVAVILNITEDHLDWHFDFDDYKKAKAKILTNQGTSDWAVFNYDDLTVRELSQQAKGRKVFYSSNNPEADFWVEEGWISSKFRLRNGDSPERILSKKELKLVGNHNLENVLAVVAVAKIFEIDTNTVAQTLSQFEGLAHRIELVGSYGGLSFYDDSKATNPDAVVRALEAFAQPVVLLLGGLNKGNSFEELAKKIASSSNKVRVVVFGNAREEIGSFISDAGLEVEEGRNLKEAFDKALKIAEPGWVVLLSPGCASFDEFSSYAERGDYFSNLVKGWANEKKLS